MRGGKLGEVVNIFADILHFVEISPSPSCIEADTCIYLSDYYFYSNRKRKDMNIFILI